MSLQTATTISGPLMVDPTILPGEDEDWTWKCVICTTINEEKDERCTICGHELQPSWCFIERGNTPLKVGLCVVMRTKLENKFGIITAINFYRRKVTIHIVLRLQSGAIELVPETLTDADLYHIEELQQQSPFYPILHQRGLCPQCHHSYTINNAKQLTTEATLPLDQMNEMKKLQEKFDFNRLAKETYKKEGDSASVLRSTAQIKKVEKKIHELNKAMEPVQVFCPFCGWPDLPPVDLSTPPLINTRKKRIAK